MFPKNFTFKQGQKISIRSKDILVVSIDDTTFYETGLDLELLPGAVQFVDAVGHGYRGVNND
jgi:hypothetical protein